MSLLSLLVTLVVIGILLWLVNNYIPMDGKIRSLLNVVVFICVVVWLLSAFGILSHVSGIRIPRISQEDGGHKESRKHLAAIVACFCEPARLQGGIFRRT